MTETAVVALEKEFDPHSEYFAERAFEAAVDGNSEYALHYLRLYRVTSRNRPYTDFWEALFEAKSKGAEDAFYEAARSRNEWHADFTGLQDPLAYLLAERGAVADARRIYRRQCRTHPYRQSALAFTCLLSDRSARRPVM